MYFFLFCSSFLIKTVTKDKITIHFSLEKLAHEIIPKYCSFNIEPNGKVDNKDIVCNTDILKSFFNKVG